MRTFLAVKLGAEALDKLQRFQGLLVQNNIKCRLTAPGNLHITIKFLGEVKNADVKAIYDVLTDKLVDFKPFSIRVSDTGYFAESKKTMRVLWCGISDMDNMLIQLHKVVDDALWSLGFTKERKPFKAHITIARDVEISRKLMDLLDKNALRSDYFSVNTLYLMESKLEKGRREYTPLFKIDFKTA